MRHRIFNEDGEEDLVFIMGWGNRWTHENISWLIGKLTAANYRVHAFELPTNISDFKADWLEPVAEYVVDLDEYQLLGHSAGALVAQGLDGADNHVYLSPWWGYNERYPELVLDLIGGIPTEFPCIPIKIARKAYIGEKATDHQLATMPRWVSPAFIGTTKHAHEERLMVEHDAVVFCSLRDPVVSHEAIGSHVPAEHVVLYDGGHELFSSPSRDQYVETVIEALVNGAEAVETKSPVRARQ